MCLSLCLSVCVWVGVCPSALPWGEVSVKSVLFSPVGRICSLQICTARNCDRSHGCCSRCRRVQRRVRTTAERALRRPQASPLSPPFTSKTAPRPALPANPSLPQAFSQGPLSCPTQVALTLPPPSLLRLALMPVSLFVLSRSLLFRFREVLQNFSEYCV